MPQLTDVPNDPMSQRAMQESIERAEQAIADAKQVAEDLQNAARNRQCKLMPIKPKAASPMFLPQCFLCLQCVAFIVHDICQVPW